MNRIGAAIAATVIGFATAASAATLTVVTTNGADVAQGVFLPGETIALRVDGNSEGAASNAIEGRLLWLGAGGTAFAATQSQMFQTVNPLLFGAGFSDVMNQYEPSFNVVQPITQTFLGTVKLIAGTPGIYDVEWGLTLTFFGICEDEDLCGTPSHQTITFTIVPEPATAALIGLGLLGLRLGSRSRSRAAPETGHT